MSRGTDATQWTAEQTLSYIQGLLKADDNIDEDDNTQYTALSIAYEYLTNATKKKITWSLPLQKLAYEFIDLAFETNMHGAIKDVFKSYRAITQGSYSESLKCVLQHYRDKKLQVILEQDFTAADLTLIRALPNIENDDPSSEIIMQSIHPQAVKRQKQLKNKLKIVWEGYKSIVETVRVNQKLEDVYMATLNKIFDFVDRYNRVQEFKSFCKSLRTGLQNAFSKRDKAEQQKAIYIDIEKTDVNTRNIEVRMEQFKVTTKLGLWSESFQVLEDINTIMRVRKVPLKNSLRCQYFENLALLFSKNHFWHFHAFAYYNYYVSYLTKPKITSDEKQNLSDRLLLSILAIPTVSKESQQSKQIQEKVSSMMITSTKVPEKDQLVELMVSKGVLENASPFISQLWNFMFLQFGVNSLKKGLELVGRLDTKYQYFKELIEATLINRQLISIAQIYQRIRIQSLERLIPLPLQKIKKMLIKAHHQKMIDFTFDQSQGIIVFEDQTQQVNPTEEFHKLFLQVASAYEGQRTVDDAYIFSKAQRYIQNAQHNIWTVRIYKIQEFKKKMKKPLLQLRKQGLQKEKEERQQRQREEIERKFKQSQALKKGEQLQKLLAMKKIIINDIVTIKEQRVVRIMDKKIEHLTDEQIDNLTIQVLQQHLQLTKRKINNNKDAKLKKAFTNVDYLERERRNLLSAKINGLIPSEQKQKQIHEQYALTAINNEKEHVNQRSRLQNLAKFYAKKIESQVQTVNNQFDKDLEHYKNRIIDNFKDKIIAKAQAILQENRKKKEQQQKQREELTYTYEADSKWSFKKREAPAAPITLAKKEEQPVLSSAKKSNNRFDQLQGVTEKQQTSAKRNQGKWGMGKNVTNSEADKKQVVEVRQKKVEPPKDKFQPQKEEKKWNIGKNVEKIQTQVKPQPPAPVPVVVKQVFVPPPVATNNTAQKKMKWGPQKKQEKKQEKKPAQGEVKKGKAW